VRVRCPRQRLPGPRRRCGGQSRAGRSPGQQSRRGPRLTLGSPAEPDEASGRLRAESPIEPWFASCDPSACHSSKSDRERNRGELMRKQTAPRTRKHRTASSPQRSGLIAKGTNAQQSATPRSALDNHSHRTTCKSAAGSQARAHTNLRSAERHRRAAPERSAAPVPPVSCICGLARSSGTARPSKVPQEVDLTQGPQGSHDADANDPCHDEEERKAAG